jgi:hypothetical protein
MYIIMAFISYSKCRSATTPKCMAAWLKPCWRFNTFHFVSWCTQCTIACKLMLYFVLKSLQNRHLSIWNTNLKKTFRFFRMKSSPSKNLTTFQGLIEKGSYRRLTIWLITESVFADGKKNLMPALSILKKHLILLFIMV